MDKKFMQGKLGKTGKMVDCILTDDELDLVAGGMNYDWYYTEDVLTYPDPKDSKKTIVKEGYRVTGRNQTTGGLLRTMFIAKGSWRQFVKNHGGDSFLEGDPAPMG